MRRRAAALAVAMFAALGLSAPASAEQAHVVTVHFEIEYDPVLPVTGCRWPPARVVGHGAVVDLTWGIWTAVTFDTTQRICANLQYDDFCPVLAGGPQAALCFYRYVDVVSVSGTATIGDHTHQVSGQLAWVPTSLPVATATMTGTLVLQ